MLLEPERFLSDRLYQIILKCDKNVSIFQIADVARAYQMAVAYDIELMIVDIHLNRESPEDTEGLRFISDIRELEKYAFVPIIILNSLLDDCLHTFWKLHCYGCLEIPLCEQAAEDMIKDALRYRMPEKGKKYLFFRDGCVIHSFCTSEVVYIEHRRRKTYVHTTEGIVPVPYQTCEEMLKQLMHYGFVICSRGTLVNLEFIRSVDSLNQYLILKEDYGTLVTGRNYSRKIKDILQQM